MTITQESELQALRVVGNLCARVLSAMGAALEPGITTAELDRIGAGLLAQEGARSAPRLTYGFPGATCISVNEEIAHGIPGDRVIRAGDLVNIDVSAEKDGFFGDTGASFIVPPGRPLLEKLCRDGQKAMWTGVKEARPGRPIAGIGNAIGRFAQRGGYTLIRNLASHGIGRSLHEHPQEVPTWPTRGDRRMITEGLVFTVEPFLSLGGTWAETAAEAGAADSTDTWTLYASPGAPTVQYEHTIVATKSGPVILTLA